MLRAVPNGWFSYDFTVYDATGASVARADLSNWKERADLEVAGTRYEAVHKSWDAEFVLQRENGGVAFVAEKPSAWKERFVFEYDGNRYELRKRSVWNSDLVLSRDGVGVVGSIRPQGVFRREWVADLPGELPLEAQVFLLWLAVLLTKRSDSATAATSGSA